MTIENPFTSLLKENGFAMLDGGLATELEKKGYDLRHPLWSAKLLLENAEPIKDVNRDYLLAGADCITTASYQLSYPGCERVGLSKDETTALLLASVQLGKQAIQEFYLENLDENPQRVLAASIGPYGAYLANGAEYTGSYDVSSNALRTFHLRRWEVLSESRADIIAFETIPNIHEAEIIRRMVETNPDMPLWISFSCTSASNINDGSSLKEVAGFFSDLEQVVAIGVNCTAPKYMIKLIEAISQGAPNKNILVYPNSGESYDKINRCWIDEESPWDLSEQAFKWYQAGAKIIGGCCRIEPRHITEIRRKLESKLTAASDEPA